MLENNMIKSITLNNFMCHKNLKIDFKNPITVIGGFNGSGKSAIMIGIGIVLGLRTYALERGSSIKSLISNGKSIAKIELVLCNKKVRLNYAFFGPEIIIERTLRQFGSASLKIKGENQKVFSTKKEDLEYILDNFQLHVDNPLNFQTQENSKKFLKNTKPENLYELFMKGTELNDVIDLHEEARQKTTEMKTKLDFLNSDLSEIEDRRKKTKRDLNIVLEGVKLDEQIVELKKEIEWSKLYTILDERKIKLEESYDDEEEISRLRDQINLNQNNVLDLQQKEALKESEIQDIKLGFENKKRLLVDSIQTYELEEREIKSDLSEIEKILDEKKTRVQQIRKLGGIDQLNDKKIELEQEIIFSEQIKENINSKVSDLRKEENRINELQKELTGMRQKESNVLKQISYLKKLETDKFSFFHKNMTGILQEIKNTNFTEDVIGPIGIYLQLKNTKWRKTLSVILKNTLSDFLVFNREDKLKLKEIFKKHGAYFSIILPSKSKNEPIDYYDVRKYTVALNVLEIMHPKKYLIMNHLIISTGLERILLIEDRVHAYRILREESKARHRYPVNIAYSLDGDKIEYRDGYMSDSRQRITQLYFEQTERKLQHFIKEKEEIQAQIKNLKSDDKSREIQSGIDKLTIDMRKTKQKISNLKIETTFEIGEDVDQEIQELESEIQDLMTQKEEMETTITKTTNSKIKAIKEMKEGLQNLPTRDPHLKKKIETFKIENNIISRKLSTIYDRQLRKEEEAKSLLLQYKTKAEVLNKKIPIVENARAVEMVKEKIRECEIKKELSLTLEKQEILQSDLKELDEMFEYKKGIIKQFEERIKQTIENIQLRIEKREALKISTARKIIENFKILTAKRNYEGKLVFNHEKKTLDLRMKVNIMAGDKNTLSGGERSFAAMCLILSIWPFIACPVKILDEFDVFMDNLNRDTILKELIEMFKESKLQIILITPLSMKLENVDYIMLQHPNRIS